MAKFQIEYKDKNYAVTAYSQNGYAKDSAQITISDVKLTLKRVEYDKNVNEPGSMTLLFGVEGSPTGASLHNALTSFVEAKYTFSLTVNDDSCSTEVNAGYYLHSARVVTKGSTATMDVKMFCYSPDKKWTFKPGCQAWSGQRFGAEILDGRKVSAHYANLNFLKCKDGEKLKDLRQAYLVQYNEPFFDFAQRTANRCGEFLYYENGDVHYGLKDDWRKNDSYSKLSGNIPTYNICLDEDLNDGTVSYSFDVMSPKGTDSDAVYNSPVGDDSFYAKPNDVCSGRLNAMGPWFLADMAFSALQGNSLSDVIEKGITAAATDLAAIGVANLAAKRKYDGDYKDEYTKETGIADDYRYGGDNPLLLNTFYSQVREAEKQVTEQKVELDWQGNFPTTGADSNEKGAYLGNLVSWTSKKYVISRMYGYLNIEESAQPDISHKTEMVPLYGFAKATKAGTGDDNPLSVPLPPLDSRPHYRSAAPQEAVVTAADDPTFMGRVRVKFAWQNDKVQSPWIRVSTPFAGRGDAGGFCMTPCVDSHVILNFLHDNIEMPYVDGGLFTKENKPDTGLRATVFSQLLPNFATQAITSRNGTGITFQDYDGSKGGWANFAGGMIPAIGVLCSTITAIKGAGEGVSPNSTMILRDQNGFFEINMSAMKRSVDIKSPLGNVNIGAFTGINITAPNGNINIEGKNVSIKAGNKLTLQSGLNIHDKTWNDEKGEVLGSIATRFALKTGLAALKAGTGVDLTNCCDISFIRAALEVFLRPVDGTLDIESRRNVVMTAGKGRVTIPMSNISKNFINEKDNLKNYSYLLLIEVFQKIKETVDGMEAILNAWNLYFTKLNDIKVDDLDLGGDENFADTWKKYIEGMDAPTGNTPEAKLKVLKTKINRYNTLKDHYLKRINIKKELQHEANAEEGKNVDNAEKNENLENAQKNNDVMKKAGDLVHKINLCIRAKNLFLCEITGKNDLSERDCKDTGEKGYLALRRIKLNNGIFAIFFTDEMGNQMTEFGEKLKKINNNKNIISPWFRERDPNDDLVFYKKDSLDVVLKKLIFQLIFDNAGIKALFDTKVKSENGNEEDMTFANFWAKLQEPKPKTKSWLEGLKDVAGVNADDWKPLHSNMEGFWGNGWEVTNRGGILISNSAGKTTRLKEGTGEWEQFDNLNFEIVNQWMTAMGNINQDKFNIIKENPDAQQNG